MPDKTELPIDDLGSVDIIGEEELTRTSPEMIEYDRQVAEAMVEADRLTANALRADPEAVPIPPRLPELPTQKDGEILKVIPSQIVTPPPANEAASSGSRSQAAASGGYQTDATAIPQNLPAGTYAFDYYLWLGTPKSNDDNRCDGVNYGAGSGCFWFPAVQYNMDYAGAGFHVGPQRGASLFGDSEDDWHLSHSGYNAPNSGLPTGKVCDTAASTWCVDDDEIPMGTWVRVRVWRLSTTYDIHTPGGWSSKWGSWAMWGGVDHQIGTNLSMRGRWIVHAHEFMEVWEATNQCSTDFDLVYFNNPASFNGSWTIQPDATATYQMNCDYTTFKRYGGEFIQNRRGTSRTIYEGGYLW